MENNPILLKQEEIKKQVDNYLNSLDEKDKIAYKIAMDHLGTSFNILRSNGFTEWQKINK
jgi:hypothetical protein